METRQRHTVRWDRMSRECDAPSEAVPHSMPCPILPCLVSIAQQLELSRKCHVSVLAYTVVAMSEAN